MAMQDDDTLTGMVPEPEAAPTPGELARARRFADLVDKALAGRTPPAIAAGDRALLEVATVIRATHGLVELAPGPQRAAVDHALHRAIGGLTATGATVASLPGGRRARRAPWIVTGASTLVAAAAIAMLWLLAPAPHAPAPRAALPAEWTSRPADSLVGPIASDRAGDASARLDAIFADRLDGLRARQLARGGKP